MILSKGVGPDPGQNVTVSAQCQMKSTTNRRGVPSHLAEECRNSSCDYGDIFPCDHPTTPMYREYEARLQTFETWKKDEVINPELLADAGLFFLGERDKCKCFYCNGGLQNWERGDDPMQEHAKYFPQCEYVLARKGPDYVANLNARFPNLARPTIRNTPAETSRASESFHIPQHNNAAMQRPEEVAQRQSLQTNRKNTFQINSLKELTSEAEKFGFSKLAIERVIDRKMKQSGSSYDCLADLINDLINDERGEPLDVQPMEVCNSSSNPDVAPAVAADGDHFSVLQSDCMHQSFESSSLRNQYQSVIDETLCKKCHRIERDCVFLDCGHLCCCYECGKGQQQCLICNSKVRDILKVFKL